jgi:outer membrane protein assembly factor BamB
MRKSAIRCQLTRPTLVLLGLVLMVTWLFTACASNPTTSNASRTPSASTGSSPAASATSPSHTGGAEPSPLVVGSTDHFLYALDAATGNTLWTFQTGDKVSAQPVTASGLVYAGSEDHSVYAVSASAGKLLWKKVVGWYPFLSPVVAGSLYVGTADNVLALRAADGSTLWSYTLHSAGTPVVADGVVYVDGLDIGESTLVALNAADGSVRWRHGFGDYTVVGLGYTPVISDGMVFITDSAGVYALDPADGSIRWHVKLLTTVPGLSPLTVQSNIIYVSGGNVASDIHLYALRSTDGSKLWEVRTDGYASRPSVASGVIYLAEKLYPGTNGTDTFAYALSAANGSTLWRAPLGTAVNLVTNPAAFAAPLVEGGIVVVGSDDSNLYGIGVTNGSIRWRANVNGVTTTPTPLLTSPS